MKGRKKMLILFSVAAALLLCCVVGGVACAVALPVNWDAGACGGGYAAFVFDKYSDELVQKYIKGSAEKSSITSVRAVKGTQSAEWEKQTLFLQFDIIYHHREKGEVTERLRFVGRRTWFDTYDWSEAI